MGRGRFSGGRFNGGRFNGGRFSSSGGGGAPAVITHSSISGTPTVGSTLIRTASVFSGTPTPTYAFEWISSTVALGPTQAGLPGDAVIIAGQTAATYVVVTADIGYVIQRRVIATNPLGSAVSVSNSVGPVVAADATAPVISGSAIPSIAENTVSIGTYTATESVTWSLTGADAAFFGITPGPSALATLAFLAPRDFETPADAGTNNVYNVTITGTDAATNIGTLAIAVTVTDVAEGLTLRQQIDGLRAQTTPNGRQTVTALKVFGVDALPTGVSLVGKVVTVSGASAGLDNWDVTDKTVALTGTDNFMTNCYYGPVSVVPAAQYPISIAATAVRPIVRYNTIDGLDGYGGPATFINMSTTGSGAAATGAQDWLIEYNRWLFPNSDILKAAGNGVNQWNYYGPLTNYPAGTLAWSAVTVYSAGQFTLRDIGGGQFILFRSFAGGNVGNNPPGTKVDDAVWESLDPHGDGITQTASDGIGCIHTRNLFDWDTSRVRAVGTTQCIRMVRNTGTSVMVGPVDFSENLLSAPFKGFYCVAVGHIREWFSNVTYALGGFAEISGVYYASLQAGNLNNPPASSPTFWQVTTNINAPGPIRFIDNWLASGSGGLYFSGMENAVDTWANNRDTVTDALVAGPVLRAAGTLIASVIGQSENVVGFAHNGSFYTGGPYPVLLAGVDAQIAVHQVSDNSGVATIHTLNASTITAKTVNPGFVALANLWHTGSGGRRLRLAADVVSGTSMGNMMDDVAGDGREYSHSATLVALAQSAWGSITRVVYNWWNSEASAAKTLWASRSAHFFGINADNSNYDFLAGPIEHCLIDTTNRGYGLLAGTTDMDLMLPGLRVETAVNLYSPPYLNYRTTSAGAEIFGMIDQNSYESYAQRDNALALAPAGNRGKVTISPSLVRFGDYSGGVQLTAPAQTSIHPAMQHKDGQILFSQDVAAHFLIAEGHAFVSSLARVNQISLTTFDFVFSIPALGTLTTQRILDAETVVTPRPHQQAVMGFVVSRGANTDRTMRPLYRTSNTDDALYPPEYRGTATITNTGTNVTGGREAVVRVVMLSALAAGDKIHFGTDGGYGVFILHGWPDYDAFMYRDGLRTYEARLSDGSATRYPGIPVRAQIIYTVISGVGVWLATAGNNQIVITTAPTVTAPVATAGANQINITG